jgi:hypothetical protein
MVELFEAVCHLDPHRAVILVVLLTIAFGVDVVTGFHDTATAVTTVIYTRTLRPIPAVFFSGFYNFLGVLLGGVREWPGICQPGGWVCRSRACTP